MNELCTRISSACSGDIITLEPNQIYHVRQDDSFSLSGYFCTNSARQDENPNGTRFCAIFLEDKKDIVIDGNGATILVHGKMTPMLFYGCENITVKNLAVDYKVPTMTEFTVLGNDDGIITIKINDDCLYRVEGNTLCASYRAPDTAAAGKCKFLLPVYGRRSTVNSLRYGGNLCVQWFGVHNRFKRTIPCADCHRASA